MPWLKQDDGIAEHPKTRRAVRRRKFVGLAAIGLHDLAMANSSRYLLDGHVPCEFVDDWCDLAGLRAKDRDAIVDVLLSSGQWHEHPTDGWTIHDYLDYNPSKADVEEQRRKDRERKAAGGRNGKPSGVPKDSGRNPDGIHAESESPVPTRPVLSNPPTPKGEQERKPRPIKFGGKPVPAATVDLATALLDDFNRQARTSYAPLDGTGAPSESLRRIVGAVTKHPAITLDVGRRMTGQQLADPYWGDGKPQPGHVFGPGVVERNLQNALGATVAGETSAEMVARRNARLELLDQESAA